MARDDYFVLAYRILSHLYECLKSGTHPDMDYLDYNTKKFPIGESYWEYILLNLSQDGYITGVSSVKMLGQPERAKINGELRITPKGIEYLAENSMMQKAKNTLKDWKEAIPGL